MRIKCYALFACEGGAWATRTYGVAADMTYSEMFSETLDSATIVVPNVPESERLTGLEPYQQCRIWAEQDGTTVFAKNMLVDHLSEVETNVREGGKYFTYTIQLMSQTKYLEKVQLPNISITQSSDAGKRTTIAEQIIRLMKMYVPKIKTMMGTSSWKYEPLITYDEDALNEKFGDECAEQSMSKPTLRQALSSLMSQKGCIPTVEDLVLGWLDFGTEPETFDENGVTTAQRSMSSESYVNNLAHIGDGIVDFDGFSVNERLVFRDRSNLLLKQTENLKLETRFPIYSIEKVAMHVPHKAEKASHPIPKFTALCYYFWYGTTGNQWMEYDGEYYLIMYLSSVNYSSGGGNIRAKSFSGTLRFYSDATASETWKEESNQEFDWSISYADDGTPTFTSNHEFGYFVSGGTWVPNELTTGSFGEYVAFVKISRPTGFSTSTWMTLITGTYMHELYEYNAGWYDISVPFMYCDRLNDLFVLADTATNERSVAAANIGGNSETLVASDIIDAEYDVTPLFVENSRRQLLNNDFLAMGDATFSSVNEMASWVYFTVGYTIGGTEITGFSSTYSVTNGWWEENYTYVEAMYKALYSIGVGTIRKRVDLNDAISSAFTEFLDVDAECEYYTTGGFQNYLQIYTTNKIYNPFFTDTNNFSAIFFDIEYNPMMGANYRFGKDRYSLPLTQMDSKSDAVSSLERLSSYEKENIRRYGNDVVQIHSRVTDFPTAKLPLLRGDHEVFSREISFGGNAYDIAYVASKDHIVKNYFTSVITKYRAYEYTSYASSVERRDIAHTHIVFDWEKGFSSNSDVLVIKNNSVFYLCNALDKGRYLFFPEVELTYVGLIPQISTKYWYLWNTPLDYGQRIVHAHQGKSDGSETGDYYDECAINASDSMISFTMLDFDNASQGIFVDGEYLKIDGSYASDPLGGIPQKWYGYDPSLTVAEFVSSLDFSEASTNVDDYLRKINLLPKSDLGVPQYGIWWSGMPKNSSGIREFVKDQSEKWGLTAEFEVSCVDDSIKVCRNLLAYSSATGKIPSGKPRLVCIPNPAIKDPNSREHARSGDFVDLYSASNPLSYVDGDTPYLEMNWANIEGDRGSRSAMFAFAFGDDAETVMDIAYFDDRHATGNVSRWYVYLDDVPSYTIYTAKKDTGLLVGDAEISEGGVVPSLGYTLRCRCLEVPPEGEYRLYLTLYDGRTIERSLDEEYEEWGGVVSFYIRTRTHSAVSPSRLYGSDSVTVNGNTVEDPCTLSGNGTLILGVVGYSLRYHVRSTTGCYLIVFRGDGTTEQLDVTSDYHTAANVVNFYVLKPNHNPVEISKISYYGSITVNSNTSEDPSVMTGDGEITVSEDYLN